MGFIQQRIQSYLLNRHKQAPLTTSSKYDTPSASGSKDQPVAEIGPDVPSENVEAICYSLTRYRSFYTAK
jgi:hypothetical protein